MIAGSGEEGEEGFEFGADVGEAGGVGRGGGKEGGLARGFLDGGGFGAVLAFVLEEGPGAFDGEALFVEEVLDFEDEFNVLAAVEALVGTGFFGVKGGEFGLPEAEDVLFDAGETADIADAEVEAIRDFGCRSVGRCRCGGHGIYASACHVKGCLDPGQPFPRVNVFERGGLSAFMVSP
jgi:hypothetical protein